MTCLLDEGRAVDVFYLYFSKIFNTISHEIITEKLTKYRLDEQSVRWTEKWLNGQPYWVVVSGIMFSWRPVTDSLPQE